MAHGKCWRAVLPCLLLFLLLRTAASLNCTSFEDVDRVYRSCSIQAVRIVLPDNIYLTLPFDEILSAFARKYCREAWPFLTSCFSQAVSSCQNKGELEDILSRSVGFCEDGNPSSLVTNDLQKAINVPIHLEHKCIQNDWTAREKCTREGDCFIRLSDLRNDITIVEQTMEGYGELFARCINRTLAGDSECGSLGAVRVNHIVIFLTRGHFGLHLTPHALAVLLGHAE